LHRFGQDIFPAGFDPAPLPGAANTFSFKGDRAGKKATRRAGNRASPLQSRGRRCSLTRKLNMLNYCGRGP
jgi:hypothetical protein